MEEVGGRLMARKGGIEQTITLLAMVLIFVIVVLVLLAVTRPRL